MMEKQRGPVTVSREELFQQVWETPMSRLAQTYGITGNGLAKICDRLGVPYPPRGYWAKKAAGKKVVQYRLPPPGPETPAKTTIVPTPPTPEPKPLSPEQQERATRVESDSAITVPERLVRPHPVIAGWLAEHERHRKEAKRDRNPWRSPFNEWTETDHRRHRILDALFKAAERHGLTVKTDERRETYFAFGQERIDFKLREKQKQVRRPKTAIELRWTSPGDRTWTQVLEPTGTLVFTIETYLGDSGIRREWLESATKPLEEQLPDIVRSLALAGPALVKLREEREEAERRRREAERLRQIEAERRQKERNQWRRFAEIARQWEEVELARRFLQALEDQQHDPQETVGGRQLGEWLVWARGQVTNHDPLKAGCQGVFENVATVSSWTYRD